MQENGGICNNTVDDYPKDLEVFPPKSVALHRLRWNMNKGSEKWLCYGGAAGIIRCQRIWKAIISGELSATNQKHMYVSTPYTISCCGICCYLQQYTESSHRLLKLAAGMLVSFSQLCLNYSVCLDITELSNFGIPADPCSLGIQVQETWDTRSSISWAQQIIKSWLWEYCQLSNSIRGVGL